MDRPAPGSDVGKTGAPAAEAYLKAVGDRVRHERQRLGLSRRALAEASGVSERYLAELERGAGNASLLVLRKVAQALHVRVEYLSSEPSPEVTMLRNSRTRQSAERSLASAL